MVRFKSSNCQDFLSSLLLKCLLQAREDNAVKGCFCKYLLCEIVFENPQFRHCIEEKNIYKTVKDAIIRAHGDFGLGCCSLSLAVKYLNAYTGIVLIRCRKDFYRLLWSAMQLITFLESKNQKYPCFFNTLHVGGTIRTCQKFLIQYNRKQLLLLLKDCKTKEERESVQRSILSCSLKELEQDRSKYQEETEADANQVL